MSRAPLRHDATARQARRLHTAVRQPTVGMLVLGRGTPAIQPGLRPRLLDPRDKLTATGGLMVDDQARSPLLKLIKRQTDGLRIELGILQEGQLAKPPELAVATSKGTREPIRNRDADDALTTACVENDGMKGAEWHDSLRHDRRVERFSTVHGDERFLV